MRQPVVRLEFANPHFRHRHLLQLHNLCSFCAFLWSPSASTDPGVMSNVATADRRTCFRSPDDRSATKSRITQLQLHKLTTAPNNRSQLNVQSTANAHPRSHCAHLDERMRRSMQLQNPPHDFLLF